MQNAPVFGAFLLREAMSKRNIILIGFMGTGKTVTGRVLSERTGMELVDMDSIIEDRAEKPISEIFAQDGEPAFRKMERELAHELSGREGLIISTGGGVVLNPGNLADFRKNGLVVCLNASPETIFQRLENDTTRPLLSGDKKEQIAEILQTRKPLYDAVEHQIDGDRLDPAGRADAILRLYELET
jgi:shikimate kinase